MSSTSAVEADFPSATTGTILIIDDDEVSQSALRQVLDSEGWHVRIVSVLRDALPELSSGEWSLVIVNVSMTGLSGPVFLTLKELALAPAVEEEPVVAVAEGAAAGPEVITEKKPAEGEGAAPGATPGKPGAAPAKEGKK